MTPPRIGSLFSGYGGLDLAVQAVYGAETAWHCQWEPPDKKTGRADPQFAAAVLAHHWPHVPNLGDITAVDWDQVLADHGPVDILTGGFPCTDVSLAGKRAGLNTLTRSGLWAHMARAIAVLRPNLVVIENVRGLLSAPAHSDVQPCTWCLGDGADEPVLRALGAVLADLAQLGFDAEWVGLPAAGVGAPHERFRIFIYAWPADTAGPRLENGWEGRPGRGAATAADADQLGAHRSGSRCAGRHEPTDHDQPAADADGRGFEGDGELPPGRDTVRPRVQADADRRDQAPADTGSGRCGSSEPDVQPGQPDAGGRAPADAASVGRREGGGPNQRGSAGDLTLPSAAHQIGALTPPPSPGGSTSLDGQLPGQLTLPAA